LVVSVVYGASVDDLTFELNGNAYDVKSCKPEASGEMVIPATYNGLPVTRILGAFENCINLTSIIIPSSVTSIGGYAFAGCRSLEKITIPDGVKDIEANAFEETSLGSGGVQLPAGARLYVADGRNGVKMEFTLGGSGVDTKAIEAERDTAIAQRDTAIAQRDTAIAERDTAIAQRDARFTMDQIKDARGGSILVEVAGEPSQRKANLKLTLEETSDLSDWSKGKTSDHVIVVNAPEGVRFYRFKAKE